MDGFPLPYLTWKINGKDVNEFKNTTVSASLITTFLIEDYKGDNINEPLIEVVYTEYGSTVSCAIPSSVKETTIDFEHHQTTTEVNVDDNYGKDGSFTEVSPDNSYNVSSFTNDEKHENNIETTTPLTRIFHIGEKLVDECSTQDLDDDEEETGDEEISSSGSDSYYYKETSSYIDEYDEYHSSSEEYEVDISASNENSVSFTATFDEETATEAVNNVPEDVEESSSDNKPIEDIDQINKSNQHIESTEDFEELDYDYDAIEYDSQALN